MPHSFDHLTFEDVARAHHAALPEFPCSAPTAMQQHPVYGRTLAEYGASARLVMFRNAAGALLGRALLLERTFLHAVSLATIFRGPIWADGVPDVEKIKALKALRAGFPRWRWRFLAVLPEQADTSATVALFKAAGMRRVMTGFSTAWVDLSGDEEQLRAQLKGTWRNQLKRAEQAPISLHVGGAKAKHYNWLLETEASQRQSRRYKALPVDMVPRYAALGGEGSVIVVTAHLSGERIAGALFLRHGNSATYHMGWNGAAGRPVYAQNLVLWRALLALKKRGVDYLDLGGLNTDQLAGIARFKLGLGHPPVRLVGSFI